MAGVTIALTAAGGLAEALQHRHVVAIATLFGAGVVSSLLPCIWPMIPISSASGMNSDGGIMPRSG